MTDAPGSNRHLASTITRLSVAGALPRPPGSLSKDGRMPRVLPTRFGGITRNHAGQDQFNELQAMLGEEPTIVSADDCEDQWERPRLRLVRTDAPDA